MSITLARIFIEGHTCDRCCAAAKAVAFSGDARLFFCGHHISENVVALAGAGWNVHYQPTVLVTNTQA